jgi:uncharacterized protein
MEADAIVLDTLSPEAVRSELAGPNRARLIRLAAEAGLAEAQAVYGQMLLDTGDERGGFGWFVRAAGQGHLMALNMVGRCYELGQGVGIDYARAAECYRAAADGGLVWGLYNYATALALGRGVAEDRRAALALFRRAADAGCAKALNYVGSFHEDGWVVERDLAEAARCYAEAARGGDFRAMFNHARMLGDAGRIEAAIAWLRRCGAAANAAFIDKAAAFLARSAVPRFAGDGVAALLEGAGRC